jgi:hypothetical protein
VSGGLPTCCLGVQRELDAKRSDRQAKRAKAKDSGASGDGRSRSGNRELPAQLLDQGRLEWAGWLVEAAECSSRVFAHRHPLRASSRVCSYFGVASVEISGAFDTDHGAQDNRRGRRSSVSAPAESH